MFDCSDLISLDTVEEKEVEWLVPGYIPKNEITLTCGDGGSGKTTMWCGVAASVSAGKKVFFSKASEESESYEPQKVLFFSAEDSLEHVLKARLRKAGARLENILSVKIQSDLFLDIKFNSAVLESLIDKTRPALMIFDPIQSFVPPNTSMSQRNAMRDCLNPLIGWGEKYSVTSLIVVHTNKKANVSGRYRIADSADIWDIARSVLICGDTKDGRNYLIHEKCNYGELCETAIFSINNGVAVFEGYSGKKDKDFVQERDFNIRQAPQRQDAEQFIFDFLRNGKKLTRELDEAARAAGISKNTLNRAKTELRNQKLLSWGAEGFGKDKAYYSYLIEEFS